MLPSLWEFMSAEASSGDNLPSGPGKAVVLSLRQTISYLVVSQTEGSFSGVPIIRMTAFCDLY